MFYYYVQATSQSAVVNLGLQWLETRGACWRTLPTIIKAQFTLQIDLISVRFGLTRLILTD